MRTRFVVPAVLAVAALALAGCVNNDGSSSGSSSSASSGSGVAKDTALVKLLPDKVKSAGVLVVGTDPTYAPNEYKDANGNPIGWEIELTNAMAAKLGLTVQYKVSKFDNIIPNVVAGQYDFGMSSFTDTTEREKQADFVNYYTAGILWASPSGKTVDPDNACGLKVAVQATTFEDTDEVPAKSKACTDAGKPAIQKLKFDAQDQATNAVVLGQVDAMSADSPVTAYAIKKTGGKLHAAGDAFDNAPYGMPIAKNSGLKDAIQKTMQSLIDDGTYGKILAKWGVDSGAVEKITVNAAANG